MAQRGKLRIVGSLKTWLGLLAATSPAACSAPLQRTAVTASGTLGRAERGSESAQSSLKPAMVAERGSTMLPDSLDADEGCTQELFARGVAFVPLQHSHGIVSPVELGGLVAGIRYRPTAAFPLVVDCRFALVLTNMGRVLRRHQVSTLEFSIAHAYRSTRAGNLSLHANGLALDIHRAILDDGTALSVDHDYVRHLSGRGCLASAKPLNQLACELAATGWFAEFLTPDDNADHRDHFHVGIPRLVRRSAPVSSSAP